VSEPAEIARELEQEDAALAAEVDAAVGLQHRVAEIASAGAELAEFERELPGERERLALALAEAHTELESRELALHEVREAPAEDEAARRRAEVRAADLVSGSERRVEVLREEQARLEARAVTFPAEPVRLAADAAEVTAALGQDAIQGPTPDPASILDWASRARAALLVRRSGLETRRERVVREANELASSVLGEEVSTSVAGVRERLERAQRR
jgi:hypothetical protein